MSGTMQPQMGGGGMPGQGGQMSPQLMQALMAAMAQRQGGGGAPSGPQMAGASPMPGGPQMPQTGPVPGMGAPPPGQPPPQGMGGGPMPPPQGMPPPPGAQQPGAQAPQVPPQPIAPPVGAPSPQMNPGAQQNLNMFGRAATGQPGPAGAGMRLASGEMAKMGRYGDSVLAHMTPGEMAVPPEVQTPQVMHALTNAFRSMGVSPQMFQAGSPNASTNPQTGANEFSILGALLPVLGAIGGSMIMPGIGTAIGGGLGGAAGGMYDKAGGMGTALEALGGAAGGFLGGGGSLGGAAAADAVPSVAGDLSSYAPTAASYATAPGFSLGGAGASGMMAAPGMTAAGYSLAPGITEAAGAAGANAAGAAAPAATSGSFMSQIPWKAGLGAGIGATLGSALAPQKDTSATPPGFNNPMPPINPNFNSLLGNGNMSRPGFNGFNPYTSVTQPGQNFNFYSPQAQG